EMIGEIRVALEVAGDGDVPLQIERRDAGGDVVVRGARAGEEQMRVRRVPQRRAERREDLRQALLRRHPPERAEEDGVGCDVVAPPDLRPRPRLALGAHELAFTEAYGDDARHGVEVGGWRSELGSYRLGSSLGFWELRRWELTARRAAPRAPRPRAPPSGARRPP